MHENFGGKMVGQNWWRYHFALKVWFDPVVLVRQETHFDASCVDSGITMATGVFFWLVILT